MHAPRTLLVGSIFVLLIAPLTFAVGHVADPQSAATPAVEKKECTDAVADTVAIEGDALAAARAFYESEPGFVDLYVSPEGLVSAWFDADQRVGLALPQPYELGGGPHIEVYVDRFAPLMGPVDAPTETAADPPLIPTGCNNRISPGVRVTTPVGGCSANFLFEDQVGRKYVGTAGHCFGAVGQRMTAANLGQVGTAVYRINGGIGNDFALVLIDQDKEGFINPAMCHWGGPTAVGDAVNGMTRHYGFGVIWSTSPVLQPRTGFVSSAAGGNSFQLTGTISSGDSGSGARHDSGPGTGLITHGNLGIPFVGIVVSAPYGFGTRLDRAINLAEAGTGLDLTLLTAPNA